MMQSFRCTNCAAPLEIEDAFSSFIRCDYCGVSSTFSNNSPFNNVQFGFGGDDLLDQARKLKEIKQLALSGQKIYAIKLYRETFGVGLKEAKDDVENIADGKPVVFTSFQTFPAASNNIFSANTIEPVGQAGKLAEIQSLLKKGSKIQAIKVYRETYGVGLKEAKDAVDEMERNGRGNPSVPANSQQPFVPRYLMQQQYEEPKSSSSKILLIVIILIIIGALAVFYFSGKMPNGITSVVDKTRDIAPNLPLIKGSEVNSTFAQEVSKFGGDGNGAGLFKDNRTVAVDSEGKIYSANISGGKIQVFDVQGNIQTPITADAARTIDELAVDGRGNLFVLQGYDLHRFNLKNTEDHSKIRIPSASDIAIGTDGTVYVSIRTGGIKAVSANGDILKTIETINSGVKGITSLAVDAAGNLYALESSSLFVFKLSPEGKFLTKFGGGSSESWEKVPRGLFYGRPNDLAIDKAGYVYVSQGVKISVFSSEGAFIEDFNTKQAFGMAFNQSSDLFVATRQSVTKYEVKK